jgi:hypothetical protein
MAYVVYTTQGRLVDVGPMGPLGTVREMPSSGGPPLSVLDVISVLSPALLLQTNLYTLNILVLRGLQTRLPPLYVYMCLHNELVAVDAGHILPHTLRAISPT